MNEYPSYDELMALQDQIAALHKRMHELDKQYPNSNREFLAVAHNLTNASWKLDVPISRAKFIERK